MAARPALRSVRSRFATDTSMEQAELFVTEYLATFIGERETAALRREALSLITSTVLTLLNTFAEVEVDVENYPSPREAQQGNERRVVIRDLNKQVVLRSENDRLLESVSLTLKAQLSAQILSLNFVAKARQAKREWEVSADLLLDEIYLFDPELRIQRLNQPAALKLGGTPQSLVGKEFSPILAGGREVLQAALPQRPEWPREFIVAQDDEYFYIRLFLVHWGYERAGYILMRSNCTADVSGQRLQLRSARMAGLGHVSVGLAHELNNPLAVILAAANTLQRRYKADPQVQQLAEIVTTEIERCRRITHALLDYGRSPDRQGSLQNLAELLQRIPARLQATHPGARVAIEALPQLYITGNEDDLMRLFTNLATNAVEAAPPASPVRIFAHDEGGKALIRVANEGAPIPADTAAKMFQPFFTTKATGTGLGLPFALKIVELMQGQIWYTREGRDNVMCVRLPLTVAL